MIGIVKDLVDGDVGVGCVKNQLTDSVMEEREKIAWQLTNRA